MDSDGKCFVHGLIDAVYNELYGLAIGKIYNPEQLAYYNRANQFPKLITINIDGSISSVMLPALSNEQDNKEKLKNMMRRAIKTSSFLLFPMMFGLAAVSEPLVKIVLTDKWIPAVPLMQLLCFSYALWPIHTINLQAISAMGRSDIFLKLEIIKKVIGITALAISVRFGIKFMVIMRIITAVISSFINAYPNKRLLNYSIIEQWKDIANSFMISIIMLIGVYMISYLQLNLYIQLTLQIFIGIIIYIVIAYILKNESLIYIKEIVGKKICKKGEKDGRI